MEHPPHKVTANENQKHSDRKARRINRARILLLSDESPRGPSKKDREIINILGISGYMGGSDTPEICGRRHSGSTE